MRPLPLIAAVCAAGAVLAGCSSTTSSAAPAKALSFGTQQSCASTLQAWARGPGGSALHAALTAGTVMSAALESGSRTRVADAAHGLNSAATQANRDLPPACADRGAAYQTAMRDWKTGAADARDGDLRQASSRIASGAHVIDVVAMLRGLSPTVLGQLSRAVAIPAESASTAPAPAATTATTATTAAPPAPPSEPTAAPTPTATSPAGCHPLSDEGTCYEPGEYCRDDNHGMSGVAGDGEAITCEDNDGWRWEPS